VQEKMSRSSGRSEKALYEVLKEAGLERHHAGLRSRGILNCAKLSTLTADDFTSCGVNSADDQRQLTKLISIIRHFASHRKASVGGRLAAAEISKDIGDSDTHSGLRKIDQHGSDNDAESLMEVSATVGRRPAAASATSRRPGWYNSVDHVTAITGVENGRRRNSPVVTQTASDSPVIIRRTVENVVRVPSPGGDIVIGSCRRRRGNGDSKKDAHDVRRARTDAVQLRQPLQPPRGITVSSAICTAAAGAASVNSRRRDVVAMSPTTTSSRDFCASAARSCSELKKPHLMTIDSAAASAQHRRDGGSRNLAAKRNDRAYCRSTEVPPAHNAGLEIIRFPRPDERVVSNQPTRVDRVKNHRALPVSELTVNISVQRDHKLYILRPGRFSYRPPLIRFSNAAEWPSFSGKLDYHHPYLFTYWRNLESITMFPMMDPAGSAFFLLLYFNSAVSNTRAFKNCAESVKEMLLSQEKNVNALHGGN
jgi:hypothetical protein